MSDPIQTHTKSPSPTHDGLPKIFRPLRKPSDDQDPVGRIDDLRALDTLTVKDPQDPAAVCKPRPSRKGVCDLPHLAKQRTPRLLLKAEEEKDTEYVQSFWGGRSLSAEMVISVSKVSQLERILGRD